MVEYLISQKNYSFYRPVTGDIHLNCYAKDGSLSDIELNTYVTDIITHEYMHKLLHNLFDITVCKLYDAIEYHFRETKIIEKALIGIERIPHYVVIEREGFNSFLEHYQISNKDMDQAKRVCNRR